MALLLASVMSVATYQLARWYLLDQRQTLAVSQVILRSQVISGQLAGQGELDDDEILGVLVRAGGRAVLLRDDTWYSTVVDLTESRIPAQLVDEVRAGAPQRQRLSIGGTPYFAIGVPLPAANAAYFEFVPAIEFERTLRTIALVLAVVAAVTTVLGAILGWVLSRRVLRPLDAVAETAQAMSGGDLQRRLDVGDDPDLRPVADSFNSMAASLEARIAREQRFTADVSHELRTPLTAMSSAVSLAQRSTTADRTSFAVDVIADQVDHLRQLTLELLELSRLDAGQADDTRESIDVGGVVRRQVELHEIGDVLRCPEQLVHSVNPVRFERVVANLLENAARYGGGATAVACHHVGSTLRIVVDDEGPGVPADERAAIFERFHRGTASLATEHAKGTGLGLSLVDEYVRLDGGRVWAEDAPGGGARFVVEIPGVS